MMSLAQIRNRVNTLCRKYGVPLAINRTRRHADIYCDLWDAALDQNQTPPPPTTLIQKLCQDGLNRPGLQDLHRYLETCRNQKSRPKPHRITKFLFFQDKYDRLLKTLPWPDPPKPQTLNFKYLPPDILIREAELTKLVRPQGQPQWHIPFPPTFQTKT